MSKSPTRGKGEIKLVMVQFFLTVATVAADNYIEVEGLSISENATLIMWVAILSVLMAFGLLICNKRIKQKILKGIRMVIRKFNHG